MERRQEFHTGYVTKREAEEELAKVLGSIASWVHVESSKMLLADFLRSEWLPAISPTIRTTTFLYYECHVERHIIPALGRLALKQFTGGHLNLFYAQLLG